MAPPSFPPAAFSSTADPMLKRALGASAMVKRRRFAALFGVNPYVRSTVWGMMREHLPTAAETCDLLWALLFLKAYAVEHVNAAIADVDEKTSRKWCWETVSALSHLPVVSSFRSQICGLRARLML